MANLQFVWERSPLQEAVDALPQATMHDLAVVSDAEGVTQINLGVKTTGFKGVSVENELVGVVSPRYFLVQHQQAFEPIVKGLDNLNIKYSWNLFRNKGKAWLSVLVDDIEAKDTVRIGFRAMNSVDGTTAIKYSFAMERVKRYIEIVGYRLACKNGMLIRVPLDEAEIVKPEIRETVKQLIEQHAKIIHTGDKSKEIQAVQYVVEAVTLLKDSVSTIIDKAQNKQVGKQEAYDLIRKYIGKRMKQRILTAYYHEDQNLWGLFNAITYIASHDRIAQSTSNGLINKAAEMLEQEIRV